MLLRPFLIPKGQYTDKGLYGLKNTLNSKGTKRSRKKEKDLSTQVEGGRREEKTQEGSTVNFGV